MGVTVGMRSGGRRPAESGTAGVVLKCDCADCHELQMSNTVRAEMGSSDGYALGGGGCTTASTWPCIVLKSFSCCIKQYDGCCFWIRAAFCFPLKVVITDIL